MTDLYPVTALGGRAPRAARFGALTLSENSDLALASLALPSGQSAPMPFGLALPEVACAVAAGSYGAFWTGRDQWMIEAEGLAETDFAAALQAQAPGCAVTEQTDGFAAIEIAASAAAPLEALLSKLVNLDPKTLGPGSCTRTGLEHMSVFLVRRSETRLAVIGMRSLAGALWHALSLAAHRLEN